MRTLQQWNDCPCPLLSLSCPQSLALTPALCLQTLRDVSRRRTSAWRRHACDPARCARSPSRCAASASPSCLPAVHRRAAAPRPSTPACWTGALSHWQGGHVQRSAVTRWSSHAPHCTVWPWSMLGSFVLCSVVLYAGACADEFACVQVPRVTWADVGGLDDVKQRLQEAVQWPHLHPEALERLGASPPRGQPLHCPLHTASPNRCCRNWHGGACAPRLHMGRGQN